MQPVVLDNFISVEVCTNIINRYREKLTPSRVVRDTTDGIVTESDTSRQSSTFFLPSTDPDVDAIRQNVASFLNISTKQIEGLQLLRYKKGEKYAWHYDVLPGSPTNQRIHTVLIYLNNLKPEDGGATAFYYQKMSITPKAGRGVWFTSTDSKGTLIKEALHAGEPILTDVEKFALNVWTRKYEF